MPIDTSKISVPPAGKPPCAVEGQTSGRVVCNRAQYSHGLCYGHYRQAHENRAFSALTERDPEVELVTVNTRVRRPVADEILKAAAEQGVSPYELHRGLLDSWFLRRTAKKR